MGTLQFIQTSPEQLAELISDGVRAELQILKRELLNNNANEELLSREEAAALLKVDLTTIWSWGKKGKIQAYGIAGRRYYKRSEIMQALKQLKK